MTLRIQRSDEPNQVVLLLVGRIQGNQVAELQALLRSETDHNLVLDLKDIKLVDRDAVRFLAQSEAAGATLRNCASYIREWISQETNGTQPPERGEVRGKE
jgi:anti-anti-sigma regulatory factor